MAGAVTPQIDPQTGEVAGKPQIDPLTGEVAQTLPANAARGAVTRIPGSTAQPGETALESLGHSFGIGKEEAQAQQQEAQQHPVRTALKQAAGPLPDLAIGAGKGFMRSTSELGQSVDALKDKNPAMAGVHAVQSIPFIGPAIQHGADQLGPGEKINPNEFMTALGTSMQVAPMLLGGADSAMPKRSLIGQIPSRARAGATLQEIRSQAANVSVVPRETMQPLSRFQDLTQRGGSTAKPATQLSNRLRSVMVPNANTPPLNFPEARDFYSNISSLSARDASRLNPTMRRQMGEVRSGLHSDLTDAASTIGRGEDYAKAIKEYAQAMRMRKILSTGAKYAIPAAIGGGIGAHFLKGLVPDR